MGDIIKIISLAVGLTVGLVLLAKVQLKLNYDNCIADKEHVYELYERFQRQDEDVEQHGASPGGIAPVMAREIPEIETATRFTVQFFDEKLTLEDGTRHNFQEAMFVDSCFFDIFATHVVQGDAKQILSTSGQCLISRRLSEKIGGDVIGRTFCFVSAPAKPMTVGGIFDEYPENSRLSQCDILMSMPSMGTYAWDGTGNLVGNDRYRSFVRLRRDADISVVRGKIESLLRHILPWDDLKEAGYTNMGYELVATSGQRMKDTTVSTTCIILSVVALVMLFTAVMNYILVVIGHLVGRARQVALRKVLGAPRREFYVTTLKEAATHLIAALALTALLLWVGSDLIQGMMGVGITILISRQTLSVLILVCIIVLLCCGILPGAIYSRIPLTYAYRLYSESKRRWKLSLLAFQFLISTMLLCLLTTIYRQYSYMLAADMGYQYDQVAYISTATLHGDSVYSLAREIEGLPCVETTAAAYSLFCSRQDGDNVTLPGEPHELFNCANMFFAESGIVETMGLQLVAGRDFRRLNHSGWTQEMIVDQHFARKMKEVAGIDDIVGRQFVNSSGGDEYPLTVVGVVKDFTIGSVVMRDERPMMIANGTVMTNYIMIKLQSITPQNIAAVQQLCDRLYPDSELNVIPYELELIGCYNDSRHTRDLITIGCLAALLITIVGLIGYVRDEVQRRTRELAIRKVMGATTREVQRLFIRTIAPILLPTVVAGAALGYYLSTLLMQQFADKAPQPLYLYILDSLAIIALIISVISIYTHRAATSNPVKYLKTE